MPGPGPSQPPSPPLPQGTTRKAKDGTTSSPSRRQESSRRRRDNTEPGDTADSATARNTSRASSPRVEKRERSTSLSHVDLPPNVEPKVLDVPPKPVVPMQGPAPGMHWKGGGGQDSALRNRAPGPHAHGNTARQATDGLWTEVCGQQKQSNDPRNNQHNPQYANYWAPLTCKRHIPPPPAQPRHTNDWAPRMRNRHQREHRPQRPTERSAPTQHAKGRTGDCPGPRKGTTTRRNVTQGGHPPLQGAQPTPSHCPPHAKCQLQWHL